MKLLIKSLVITVVVVLSGIFVLAPSAEAARHRTTVAVDYTTEPCTYFGDDWVHPVYNVGYDTWVDNTVYPAVVYFQANPGYRLVEGVRGLAEISKNGKKATVRVFRCMV